MMKPQRQLSPATIARKAREAARHEADPVKRNALLAIAGAAKLIRSGPTSEQVKQALRQQTTAILLNALARAIADDKQTAAQWVREVLAERNEE